MKWLSLRGIFEDVGAYRDECHEEYGDRPLFMTGLIHVLSQRIGLSQSLKKPTI